MKTVTNPQLRKKISSNRGESISETLVALLISALAIVMLAGAISAASSIVRKSREKLNDYYNANEVMATMTGTDTNVEDTPATATLSLGVDSSITKAVTCKKNKAFGDGDKAVIVYKVNVSE